MSIASTLLGSGLKTLVAVSGEVLAYGQQKVTALVNRSVTKPRDGIAMREGQLDFGLMGLTEIEIQMTEMPTRPKAANTFIDSLGVRHTVMHVTHTDLTWICYCQPSQTA